MVLDSRSASRNSPSLPRLGKRRRSCGDDRGGSSSIDDLPYALSGRLVEIVALHQVAAQADVLREAAPAELAAEVPAAAALVLEMLGQTGPDLVASLALRALQGEVLVPQVARVPRPPRRSRLNGHPYIRRDT